MRAEAWIFAICTVFFLLVAPAYWFIAGDPTGTSALVMTFLLTLLVTLYLGVHASKMEPRPEDRQDAEIADGAGELGFFPPYSWWPLWCGATLGGLRVRDRDGRLVAVHHGRRGGLAGPVRVDLRVLRRRARALIRPSPRPNVTGPTRPANRFGGLGLLPWG